MTVDIYLTLKSGLSINIRNVNFPTMNQVSIESKLGRRTISIGKFNILLEELEEIDIIFPNENQINITTGNFNLSPDLYSEYLKNTEEES